MSSHILAVLKDLYICIPKQGWTALMARRDKLPSTFKTQRIGKLMPDGELQFTVGATQAGQSCKLNKTIQMIIEREGLQVLPRQTTSGSRANKAPYPTFQIEGVSREVVTRIAHRIEGAVIHSATGGAA